MKLLTKELEARFAEVGDQEEVEIGEKIVVAKFFNEGRYDECWNELAMYDWGLEEVEELSECEKWILDKEGEEALARYQGRI